MVFPFLRLINNFRNNRFFVALYTLIYFAENIFFKCFIVNKSVLNLKRVFIKKFLSFRYLFIFNFLKTRLKYKFKNNKGRRMLNNKLNFKTMSKGKLKIKIKYDLRARTRALKHKILKSLKFTRCFTKLIGTSEQVLLKSILLC